MTSSLVKEARDTSTVGPYRACSNERSEKNKYSDGEPSTESRVSSKEPICYGYGQKRE